MGRLFVASSCALALAVLVIAACGDSYNDAEATGPKTGTLDGKCFENSTCNAGLACTIVEAEAKCRPAASDGGATPTDASTSDAPREATTQIPEVDAAATVCNFMPDKFPCAAQAACYGAGFASSVCVSGACQDPANQIRLQCFSSRACGDEPCCLQPDALSDVKECMEGRAFLSSSSFSKCTGTCDDDEYRLCVDNSDCRSGQSCRPVGLETANGPLKVVVGICR